MANGKLKALLAEWRQKRLLILGWGSATGFSRLLLEAGAGYGLRPDGPGKLDQEVWTWRSRDWSSGWGSGARVLEEFGGGCGVSHPGDASGKSGPGGAAPPGAAVTSEMEIFFQVCPCPVIAVTGSDEEDHHHDSPG